MKSKNKHIWKMSGWKKGESLRVYCYVECYRMDDAFKIARSTFGEQVITSAQRLAHGEKMDETLPYFIKEGGDN